jgi:hypothetical protein
MTLGVGKEAKRGRFAYWPFSDTQKLWKRFQKSIGWAHFPETEFD